MKRNDRELPTTGMYDKENEIEIEVTMRITRYADEAIVVISLGTLA
jgi:hypothetical protein